MSAAPDQPTADMPLPARLDTAAVRALHATLLGCRGSDLRLDAGAVQQLGGLCLQALLAAEAAWRADGVQLEVRNLSAAMEAGLKQFGLTPASPPFIGGPEA